MSLHYVHSMSHLRIRSVVPLTSIWEMSRVLTGFIIMSFPISSRQNRELYLDQVTFASFQISSSSSLVCRDVT
jgi:hypothetical protein